MNLVLQAVLAPVIVSPALMLLSERRRKMLMLLYIAGLLYLGFYILTGAELGHFSFFRVPFQTETNFLLFSFTEHPYAKIAAFGFLFVGAIGLLFGLNVSSRSEQAVSIAAIAGAIGVSLADNFLTLLFFWEVLTLTTSALIFLKRTPHAVSMAYRALFFSLVSGFSLTVGIVLQYNATGTFDLMYPEAGLFFFILGIGIKTAFLPLHFWVPWGYPAASFPSSVLLAALCTKVGVYAVARILPPSEFINIMGACMAIFAVTFALLQSDLRKLLSFHIISQVGYMVAGVGLGSAYGVDGALLHLVNHMIYKALLFMSAGALIYCVGTENLHELHDHESHQEDKSAEEGTNTKVKQQYLWRLLPVAFIGALAGALAISGTPPFNGYVSKYLLKKAMHGVNPSEWLLLAAGVGTALSFTKFVYFGFIKAQKKVLRKLTWNMQAAILILSASCLITGIFPQIYARVLPYQSSLHVYSLDGMKTALQYVVIGIVIFILIAKLLEKEMPKLGLPFRVSFVVQKSFTKAVDGMMLAFNNSREGLYRSGFTFLQALDYKPGKSETTRLFNVSNIDFDVLLIMIMLGIVLVVLFFLQFGTELLIL